MRIFITISLLLLVSSNSHSISRRHDVDASFYRNLAQQFPAVGQFGGCSATLVAPNKVLTAAHCLDENADGMIDEGSNPTGTHFRLGNDLRSPSFQARIASFAIHPRWQQTNRAAHDLCVLTLETAITGVNPMTITARDPVGQTAITIGFGLTGTGLAREENENIKHAAENRMDAILPLNDTTDGTGALVSDFDHPSEEARYNTLTTLQITSSNKPLNLEGSTAPGDSGGPVTVDFGQGAQVVGVTSGGFNPLTEEQSRYGDINESAPIRFGENIAFLRAQGLTINEESSAMPSNTTNVQRVEENRSSRGGGGSSSTWGLMSLALLLLIRRASHKK